MHSNLYRELSASEIDAVAGGPSNSDALGNMAAGLGLIALSATAEMGTGGLATPLVVAGVAAGVSLIHLGLAELLISK